MKAGFGIELEFHRAAGALSRVFFGHAKSISS